MVYVAQLISYLNQEIFPSLATDERDAGRYYIVICLYDTQLNMKLSLMQKTISSGERVVNKIYFAKLRVGKNWYSQTDSNEVFIPLFIIVHSKLNPPPPPNCVNILLYIYL